MPPSSMSVAWAALSLALAGCANDDANDNSGSGTATTETNADATDTTGAANSSDTNPSANETSGEDTASVDSTSSDASTGAVSGSSSGDSSGSTTQGAPTAAELINDAWFEGVAAAYMGGFVQDECWASTFVPEAEHYPFTVDAIRLLIGGTDDGTGEFSIGLWSVDANNQPETELASAVVELTGVNKDIDFVLLGPAGIESPVFDEGNFAIVGCLVSHAGYPGIAADTNGQVDYPDRNWIRTTDGQWAQSAGLGVGGDWVMRAFILPEG